MPADCFCFEHKRLIETCPPTCVTAMFHNRFVPRIEERLARHLFEPDRA